jgi:hypothetical protein
LAALQLLNLCFQNDALQRQGGEFLKVAASSAVLDETVQKNVGVGIQQALKNVVTLNVLPWGRKSGGGGSGGDSTKSNSGQEEVNDDDDDEVNGLNGNHDITMGVSVCDDGTADVKVANEQDVCR